MLEGRLSFFNFFLLPIKNMDQTEKFQTRKKCALLKEECDIFRGSCAIAGLAGLVPFCYCAFVVISGVLNFPRGYFVGLKFFLVGISWLGLPDCNIFSRWLLSDRNQKYINTSKTEYSIPNQFQLFLVLFKLVLHLLNQLCHYTALLCTNCIFIDLFSSVLGSLHSLMDFITIYY